MKQHLIASLSGITAIAISSVSLAHHSHGNYDVRNYSYLSGAITEVVWLNPHIWLQLETEEGELWALEGGSIQAVASSGGWHNGDLEKGDRISVRCHAQRDGSNGCLLGYITLEGEDERVFD